MATQRFGEPVSRVASAPVRWGLRARGFGTVALLVAGGCGGTASVGLANAPGASHPPDAEWSREDVVANGDRSCPRGGHSDPLPNRIPPCVEDRGRTSAAPAAPAAGVYSEEQRLGWSPVLLGR